MSNHHHSDDAEDLVALGRLAVDEPERALRLADKLIGKARQPEPEPRPAPDANSEFLNELQAKTAGQWTSIPLRGFDEDGR